MLVHYKGVNTLIKPGLRNACLGFIFRLPLTLAVVFFQECSAWLENQSVISSSTRNAQEAPCIPLVELRQLDFDLNCSK